jgi:3',5'-cyclic AMP phosphodiesterase CpdA
VTSYLLAHLSDAHIGPLPQPIWRELMGKRFTGYMNWKRRKGIHDMEVLMQLVEDIKAQRPDHIMMTGDVLNIGLAAEFPIAAQWLHTLGPTRDVSFVPGNHDAYVPSSLMQLMQTFAPWTGDDGAHQSSYPYLRVRGDIAFIGLSSGVPTPFFIASGRVGLEQREAFAKLLDETAARGLMRVVMIHHPPYRGGATPGRGLTDARQFEKVIAQHGAELIVHGHNHRQLVRHLDGPRGKVPVIGVASASAVPGTPRHRAAYHLYRVTKQGERWHIQGHTRGTCDGQTGIIDLGPVHL